MMINRSSKTSSKPTLKTVFEDQSAKLMIWIPFAHINLCHQLLELGFGHTHLNLQTVWWCSGSTFIIFKRMHNFVPSKAIPHFISLSVLDRTLCVCVVDMDVWAWLISFYLEHVYDRNRPTSALNTSDPPAINRWFKLSRKGWDTSTEYEIVYVGLSGISYPLTWDYYFILNMPHAHCVEIKLSLK